MTTQKRLAEIYSGFAGKKILVVGDVILDRYIFGQVERISPEAPVPVLKVSQEEFRLGGAGNVAANIATLGGEDLLLGVCGDDMFAREIANLKNHGDRMVRCPHNRTIVKTRVISQRQQIVRIDREETINLQPDTQRQMIAQIVDNQLDGILVSDYAKGTLNEAVMTSLKERAKTANIPIIVDPKPPNFHLYSNITGITPNLIEAEQITRKKIGGHDDAAKAARSIQKKFKADFSLVTRGGEGITASEKGRRTFHLPAYSHEVFDVTGAGDTVAAVLILSLVSGASLKEAVFLANAAASIVIEKIGTSQVTIEELQSRVNFLLRNKRHKH